MGSNWTTNENKEYWFHPIYIENTTEMLYMKQNTWLFIMLQKRDTFNKYLQTTEVSLTINAYCKCIYGFFFIFVK
jgi:hypothetical protein